MGKTRKIAECINVRINVGNYQHIELVKYAEETIEFDSEKERIEKENALRDDLVANLMRSMTAIPEKMKRGVAEAQAVEEAIKSKLPDWLANGPVPNIANSALKKEVQVSAEQKDNKDTSARIINESLNTPPSTPKATVTKPVVKPTEEPKPTESVEKPIVKEVAKSSVEKITNPDDLFEDDKSEEKDLFEEEKSEPAKQVVSEAKKEVKPTKPSSGDDFDFDDFLK